MKKKLLTFALLFTCFAFVNAQNNTTWQYLNSKKITQSDIKLVKSSEKEIVVKFSQNAFGLEKVLTPKGDANILIQSKGSSIQKKGAPDLGKLSQSIIIPDYDEMSIEVVKSEYVEFENIQIAPSKGILSREINPKDVPFEYGIEYQTNAFFPSGIAYLNDPYIIRDHRGQTIVIQPYQYNPMNKVLRVYNEITVRISSVGNKGINTLQKTKSGVPSDNVFEPVYKNQFLNYTEPSVKYTPVGENGKMLIITYDSFAGEMQAFVDWKNSIGIQTEMVNYSTIGSSSALKTYVKNYYDTNGLTFLLLVGDHAQVPTSSTSAGDSDNNYGYTSGTDHYLDIFVGRFSAENTSQVATQVNRTLYYERDMSSSNTIITKGIGIASNEGATGGDMNENDEQHMNNIETDLVNYGYSITRCYQNGGSTSQLSSLINAGTGIINYVGHGSDISWAAPSFSSTNVNALTNTDKFPFIISVACVVGNFKMQTCFAEAWLRATSNSSPTGALVFCGSTINQSWASPMRAQDEMNDLLVANTFKSYGGIFANGMFEMIDAYGTDGANMADTWTVFGDPSVQTRTPGHPDSPQTGSSCGTPSNLTTSNITNVSATVSWAVVSDAQSYILAYKAVSATSWIESTENSTSKNLTGLSEGTAYEFKLKTNCAGGSSAYSPSKSFTTTGNVPIQYCDSKGANASSEWIAEVKVGTFTNTSQSAGYTDFTNKTVTMAAGTPYSITLTPGFSSSVYNEYWKIWIDLNSDGDFDDPNENAFDAGSLSNTTVTGSIAIPAGTAETITRMRVSMKYNAAPTACEASFSYGEVEDYTVNITGSTPDTQAPTVPGNLTSSNITSTSASLTWTASTDNIGVDHYTVYSNGSSIGNTNSTSYNVSGLTASTTYSFTVKAFDAANNESNASNALNVTTLGGSVSYCASKGSNSTYEWIDLVEINGMSNPSANDGGYADNTSKTANVVQGELTTITFSCGFASSTYAEYWHVWIDWNQNGTFESGEEMVTTNSSSSSNLSGTFTVPTGALTGTTRMRVSMKYNATATACETFSYGEVEDYTINVTSRNRGNDSYELSNMEILLYPNPAQDHIDIKLSGESEYGKARIFTINGSLVKTIEILGFHKEIDISDIVSGIYYISIETNNEIITEKFIKQ